MNKPIGILVNPASGKDIRRLVAKASVFDNREKSAIVRRAVIGAVNAGAKDFVYFSDTHNIAGSAINELSDVYELAIAKAIYAAKTATAVDTVYAAEAMKEADCAGVLVLGGDGTNRVFVKGWRHAILLPLSTGTNNVFPEFVEATVAGAAIGLLAAGVVNAEEVTRHSKIVDIEIENEASDIALIDAVVTNEKFTGARALLEPEALRLAVLTRADAAAVGITSIGGLIDPVSEQEDMGLVMELGEGKNEVRAPIAPGMYQSIKVGSVKKLEFGEIVEIEGPCMLAFDGERERVLKAGQKAKMRLSRTGPRVMDVEKIMKIAACKKIYTNIKIKG